MTKPIGSLKRRVLTVIETYPDIEQVNLDHVVGEVLLQLDPDDTYTSETEDAVKLTLRQFARQICRTKLRQAWKDGTPKAFPKQQARYPKQHARGTPGVYVPLEDLTDEDIAFNIALRRRGAIGRLRHANSLVDWYHTHRPNPLPAVRRWKRPGQSDTA
jgi:hypothetical protein